MTWIISQALITDYKNWRCSQALAGDYLEVIYSAGVQSVQSSGIPTQPVYLSPDKMTAFSRLSRFGMMCKLLTEDRGEDLLTWYLEGSRAKTYPVQEKEQALPENGQECGRTWRGSLAKYDPDTHLLKTAQCSLLEDSTPSCVTLPRWGTMRNGELYQRQIVELHTRGKESGLLLATPTATANQLAPSMMKHKGCAMWATPTTMDKLPPKSAAALEREATVARPGRSKPANLRDQVSNMDRWPTPAARDWKGARKPETMELTARNPKTNSLPDAVEFQNGETGRLNPQFVEWLMGWPLGWTDLQPLAMDKFQEWRQQHLKY